MAVAAAVDKRGLKRICMSCSTRFYDFSKRPIVCPNCATEFTGDIKIRTRRARPLADDEVAVKAVEEVEIEVIKDDEEEVAAEEAEVVSLEEAEAGDDGDDVPEDTPDADLDLDEDDDDLDDDDDDEDDDIEDEEDAK